MKIGAHTSTAGGLPLAFERSAAIGANSLQIFAKSPRSRGLSTCTETDFVLAQENRKKYGQIGGLIHANYLANLSKPFDDCQKDIASIINDFYVGHHTGFEGINVHIGKQKGYNTRDEAFEQMKRNVIYILEEVNKNGYSPKFLFEITAGQGSELGTTIEEIGYFYKNYLSELPIAFCFDTAHARGAGNDLTKRDDVIGKRDDHIGVDKLFSFHLNDAKVALGSHLDRHAPLGRGAIGRPALIDVIQRAAKNEKGIYLETPDNERRPEEIAYIKDIIAGNTQTVKELHDNEFQTELLKKFQADGAQSLFG